MAERPSTAVRERQRAVRRRRRNFVAIVAALAAVAGAAVGSGSGETPPAPSAPPAVPLEKLIGQSIVVRMEGATKGLERRARHGQIGGVIIFPPPESAPSDVRGDVKRLQRAAKRGGNPPLLVATDQEGGLTNRFPFGPPSVPAPALGSQERADAKLEGEAAANFLAQGGINVDLAPVLDVSASEDSFIHARSYGTDVDVVTRTGAAFIIGLDKAGTAATAKHFPGLGLASTNTDFAPAAVSADVETLREQEKPFRAAIRVGVPLIMVSNASYDALDPGVPAALSEKVVTDELRDRLGYTRIVITDDLEADSIAATATAAQAAVRAARAGVDLLMFARTGEPASQAARNLRRAVESGELERAALQASYDRILAVKRKYAE